MKTHLSAGIVASLFLLNAHPASADYLRCGLDLISEGNIKVKVLKSCGEPIYVQKAIQFDPDPVTSTFEGWVYEKDGYYYILHFRGLRVVSIERSHKRLP